MGEASPRGGRALVLFQKIFSLGNDYSTLRQLYISFSSDTIVNVRIAFVKSIYLIFKEKSVNGKIDEFPREFFKEKIEQMLLVSQYDEDLFDALVEVRNAIQ